MTRPRKPGNARFNRGDNIPPYNEHMKQLYEFATTKRVVRSGGVTKELTHYQVVMHKQLETAIAGNSVAQRDVMRKADIAVQSRDQFIETQCDIWTLIKDRHQRAIDAACGARKPPPRDLPHPADINISYTDGVTFLGPMDEESWRRCDAVARFRDALFVQQIMEDADDCIAMDERPSSGAALVHAMYINLQLPPSFRLSDAEIGARMFRLLRLSKREAFVRCGEAWKAAGRRLPRGQRYGSLAMLEQMIAAQSDLVQVLRQRNMDPQACEVEVAEFFAAIKSFCTSSPQRTVKEARAPMQKEVLA